MIVGMFEIFGTQALMLGFNVLVQVTLIALASLWLTRFLRNRPAVRHCILLVAITLIAISPIATSMMQISGIGMFKVTSPTQTNEQHAPIAADSSALPSNRIANAELNHGIGKQSEIANELHDRSLNHESNLNKAVVASVVEIGSESPCLLYTSPSPRDRQKSRMPSSA